MKPYDCNYVFVVSFIGYKIVKYVQISICMDMIEKYIFQISYNPQNVMFTLNMWQYTPVFNWYMNVGYILTCSVFGFITIRHIILKPVERINVCLVISLIGFMVTVSALVAAGCNQLLLAVRSFSWNVSVADKGLLSPDVQNKHNILWVIWNIYLSIMQCHI